MQSVQRGKPLAAVAVSSISAPMTGSSSDTVGRFVSQQPLLRALAAPLSNSVAASMSGASPSEEWGQLATQV
jgi:hypothetical protein